MSTVERNQPETMENVSLPDRSRCTDKLKKQPKQRSTKTQKNCCKRLKCRDRLSVLNYFEQTCTFRRAVDFNLNL